MARPAEVALGAFTERAAGLCEWADVLPWQWYPEKPFFPSARLWLTSRAGICRHKNRPGSANARATVTE